MSDSVSVLLPVYNGAKYLGAAIESVLAQSRGELELIVVDDCSSDGSADIIAGYAAQDKRVRFERNQSNLGLFRNYNRALELSQGQFIKPFAQDDLLHPDCLALTVPHLQNNSAVSLVTCGRNWVDAAGSVLRQVVPFPAAGVRSGKLIITWSLITLTNFVGEPVVGLFRAGDRGAGYDPRYFHYGDLELWMRLLQKGDMYFVPDVLCSFRSHDLAATRHNHRTMIDLLDAVRLGHQYFSYLEELGESREHFHKRVVEFAAMQVDHLARNENLDENGVRKNGPDGGPGSDVNLEDDFAEAFFLALRYITPTLAELDHLKRCREKDHLNFDAEIKKIHSSISWKVTAPLRALRQSVPERS
ncbi:MAG: glycosyltransferase family 2 protein [Cyanobacteria bacterium SZAS LIN-3]|nr:glycosyltransferase family 2 protein [Cyanobacteria bacterium SZAS LIN-3]